jgi:6-phosphogluconolactonase
MEEIEWWEFDSAAEMAGQVAGDIGFVIESAVAAHGSARIALPPGREYEVIHAALAARKDIDWAKLTLVPTDDRLVPSTDESSGYGALARTFGGKGATIVALADENALGDYGEAGRLADARLATLEWPLDLVWLGVGADGHSLGMFAGPDLDRALSGPRERRAVGVRPDPMPAGAAGDRVTLTASAVSSARAVMVTLFGDEQRSVLESAIKDGPLSDKPIGRLLAEIDSPVDIFWSA